MKFKIGFHFKSILLRQIYSKNLHREFSDKVFLPACIKLSLNACFQIKFCISSNQTFANLVSKTNKDLLAILLITVGGTVAGREIFFQSCEFDSLNSLLEIEEKLSIDRNFWKFRTNFLNKLFELLPL